MFDIYKVDPQTYKRPIWMVWDLRYFLGGKGVIHDTPPTLSFMIFCYSPTQTTTVWNLKFYPIEGHVYLYF